MRSLLKWGATLVFMLFVLGTTLTYTVPDKKAAKEKILDWETGDSIWVTTCYPSTEPASLGKAQLWGVPATGGSPEGVLLAEHDVRNMAGQTDSFIVDPGPVGWHYWLVVYDSTNTAPSCISDVVYVGAITGIDPQPEARRVERIFYFDLQGRKVVPKASGIYFQMRVNSDGTKDVKKTVILK